jgi:hypothetical protein
VDEQDREVFRIVGTIGEEETGRPLGDPIVRAFDRDVIFDDKVGFADVGESAPDPYLRVPARAGRALG